MFREYSTDTPIQFDFFLNYRKLNEIMPYYNELLFRRIMIFYQIVIHMKHLKELIQPSHSTGSASNNDSSHLPQLTNTTSQLALHQTPASF